MGGPASRKTRTSSSTSVRRSLEHGSKRTLQAAQPIPLNACPPRSKVDSTPPVHERGDRFVASAPPCYRACESTEPDLHEVLADARWQHDVPRLPLR